MHVLQYAVLADPPLVQRPPARCAASLNTHDAPTFAAWLEGGDIEDSLRLGFIDGGAAVREREKRRREREVLARFLKGRGLVHGAPSAGQMMTGSLRHLARSRAKALMVNIEDLWLETRRQNIPGTGGDAYPNWRGRAARTIDEIETDHDVAETLRLVSADRSERRST
jgi:4-alpha-glucanotransferase